METLQRVERMDVKQMLKRLVKHVTESHESAAKAGKELMGLLDYLHLQVWLQVVDMMTRPLVYMQVPKVVETIKEAQNRIDKTKLLEGEVPIDDIIHKQNLPDMAHLQHVWGYDLNDIGEKRKFSQVCMC